MAELLAGNMKVHICYAVKAGRAVTAVAQPQDAAMIPVLRDGSGTESAKTLKPGGALTVRAEGLEARFALPRLAGPILSRIDGRRTLADIHAELAASEGARFTWMAFTEEFGRLYGVFNAVNKMFLSHDNNKR